MSDPIKLQTDSVILRNVATEKERITTRIYADRKVELHPSTYKIIEQCQILKKTSQSD